jgi:hypothetical protein
LFEALRTDGAKHVVHHRVQLSSCRLE